MKEALVLVPGMMCDARVFLPQIAEMSRDRAICVASLSGKESIEDMAQAVLAQAPDRFALAGLSMGGIVAMEVLRRAPERVTGVALMSTSAQSERPAQAAEREPLIVQAKSGRLTDAMAETLKPDHLAPGPARAEVLATMMEMAESAGPDAFVDQSRALQRRPDQQKTLRITRVPAYVICGAHDSLTPVRRHEFMAELIPHATLRVIPEAGHIPTLEAPVATTAVLREWLSAPLILR